MTKEKLIEIIQNILKTDIDLGFLLQLRQKELEILVACIRERVEHFENWIFDIFWNENYAKNNWKNTPLHSAAWYGHLEIAERLLKHGADLDAKEQSGKTAKQLAIQQGHESTAELLQKYSGGKWIWSIVS